MTTWYIGIDETGEFNHLNPNDNSNVSAAVTKRSPEELFGLFHTVARDIYRIKTKPNRQWKKLTTVEKHVTLEKFHGCEQNNKFTTLDSLLQDSELIDCIIQSKGRPFVTVNPQQWWIAAVIGVMQKFFSINKCKKGDKVHIEIAIRDDRSLGLRFIPKKEIFEQYNSQIASCIEKELKRSLKNRGISLKVSLQAAGYSELPTLGDQASNMIKSDYQIHAADKFSKAILKRIKPIEASPFSISLGNNVKHLISKDNLQGAIEVLLSEVLNGNNENIDSLDEIISKSNSLAEGSHIWETIITSCETALWNRGTDGNAINRAGVIITRLIQYYESIPSDSLKNKFFHVNAEYMGHAGNWDDTLFKKIEDSFKKSDTSFSNPLKRWNYYLNLFSDKAQTYFNNYKFGELESDYKLVTKIQDQIDSLKFPFDPGKKDPDQNYSIIYGTIGQDLAFQGKYSEAIRILEKIFNRSPAFFKGMCASFICICYLKQQNLEKAKEWNSIQGDFSPSTNDQWYMLDKLRINALATELDREFENPDISIWCNEGDYPWPLLLKWSAYIEYKKGKKTTAFQRLENARKKLTHSSGFTIRTLALSVIAMQIFIAQDGNETEASNLDTYRANYQSLLDKCVQESVFFDKHVQINKKFSAALQKASSLWEAANLLPFNFS